MGFVTTVEVVVLMGMAMVVGMGMAMLMAVGMPVVGVLVGMRVGVLVVMLATGDMVVIDVHGIISFTALHLLLLQTDWLLGSEWADGSSSLRGIHIRAYPGSRLFPVWPR